MNTLHWDASGSDERAGGRADVRYGNNGIERRMTERRRAPVPADLYQRLEQKRGALEEERRRSIRRLQDRPATPQP